jgi:hypothetical protein
MGRREFDRVRRIALALLEVSERLSDGEPRFFVAPKYLIAELEGRR